MYIYFYIKYKYETKSIDLIKWNSGAQNAKSFACIFPVIYWLPTSSQIPLSLFLLLAVSLALSFLQRVWTFGHNAAAAFASFSCTVIVGGLLLLTTHDWQHAPQATGSFTPNYCGYECVCVCVCVCACVCVLPIARRVKQVAWVMSA